MNLPPVFLTVHKPPISGLVLVFAIIGLIVLTAWLKSPRGKGHVGEWWVRRVYLRRLDPTVYHCLHDLLIPDAKGGLTQIDHVVVSPFGIFVIETKNYAGWIFGTEHDQQWTVSYKGGRKERFLNPLLQNRGHIRAVEQLLELAAEQCHNVVFFTGDAEFKKGPVPGVLQSGLARHIQAFQTTFWDTSEVRALVARLRGASLSGDPKAKAAHLAQVRSRKAKPLSP